MPSPLAWEGLVVLATGGQPAQAAVVEHLQAAAAAGIDPELQG